MFRSQVALPLTLTPLSLVTKHLCLSKAEEKLVAEFNFLRSQSSGTLTRFLDFIAADYMIENVLLMMKGAMKKN